MPFSHVQILLCIIWKCTYGFVCIFSSKRCCMNIGFWVRRPPLTILGCAKWIFLYRNVKSTNLFGVPISFSHFAGVKTDTSSLLAAFSFSGHAQNNWQIRGWAGWVGCLSSVKWRAHKLCHVHSKILLCIGGSLTAWALDTPLSTTWGLEVI